MAENISFVVNDRRKFTAEGELRHDSPAAESAGASSSRQPEASQDSKGPQLISSEPVSEPGSSGTFGTAELADLPESDALGALDPSLLDNQPGAEEDDAFGLQPESFPEDASLPPGPTAEQSAEAARAYEATIERLDFAMRAANPGGERMPEMSFERLVQSLYTQALMLLGGAAEPGETPRVDILGARQTIDMLVVMASKSKGNLTPAEDKLLESALFDLRMGFLEITQALARQAAQRQTGGGPGGMPPAGAGPRIVR